jgi:hypothetical protein
MDFRQEILKVYSQYSSKIYKSVPSPKLPSSKSKKSNVTYADKAMLHSNKARDSANEAIDITAQEENSVSSTEILNSFNLSSEFYLNHISSLNNRISILEEKLSSSHSSLVQKIESLEKHITAQEVKYNESVQFSSEIALAFKHLESQVHSHKMEFAELNPLKEEISNIKPPVPSFAFTPIHGTKKRYRRASPPDLKATSHSPGFVSSVLSKFSTPKKRVSPNIKSSSIKSDLDKKSFVNDQPSKDKKSSGLSVLSSVVDNLMSHYEYEDISSEDIFYQQGS